MSEMMKSYRRPTMVASTVLALGGLSSLAINLKAIYLSDATPEGGAIVSGLFWPLALLASIELLIHTPWRNNKLDGWVKAGILVLVAGVAAWISYWHGAHVLSHWGYDQIGQYAGPLVPDAAMLLATLALMRVGQARRMAKDVAVANPGHMAITDVATGQDIVAAPVAVATPLPHRELDEDWGTLDADLDRELAEMAAGAQNEPEPTTVSESTTESAPAVKLTTVPQAAAVRIMAALENGTADATLDAKLEADGIAGSARTARRWRAALANGTARVS